MDGNGHLAERVAAVEADEHDLRQLFMDEMRALRGDFKTLTGKVEALAELVRDTGRAVDTLLAELKLRDQQEEESDA